MAANKEIDHLSDKGQDLIDDNFFHEVIDNNFTKVNLVEYVSNLVNKLK